MCIRDRFRRPERASCSEGPNEPDALSGLLNRSGFNVRVRALIDAHPDEAYVLVYGDIDRFKAYNDLFGTSAGDSLLADIGEMIRRNLPSNADVYKRQIRDSSAHMALRSTDR